MSQALLDGEALFPTRKRPTIPIYRRNYSPGPLADALSVYGVPDKDSRERVSRGTEAGDSIVAGMDSRISCRGGMATISHARRACQSDHPFAAEIARSVRAYDRLAVIGSVASRIESIAAAAGLDIGMAGGMGSDWKGRSTIAECRNSLLCCMQELLNAEGKRATKARRARTPQLEPRAGTVAASIVDILARHPQPLTVAELRRLLPALKSSNCALLPRQLPHLVGARIGGRGRSSAPSYFWHRKHDKAARAALTIIEKQEQQELLK